MHSEYWNAKCKNIFRIINFVPLNKTEILKQKEMPETVKITQQSELTQNKYVCSFFYDKFDPTP